MQSNELALFNLSTSIDYVNNNNNGNGIIDDDDDGMHRHRLCPAHLFVIALAVHVCIRMPVLFVAMLLERASCIEFSHVSLSQFNTHMCSECLCVCARIVILGSFFPFSMRETQTHHVINTFLQHSKRTKLLNKGNRYTSKYVLILMLVLCEAKSRNGTVDSRFSVLPTMCVRCAVALHHT